MIFSFHSKNDNRGGVEQNKTKHYFSYPYYFSFIKIKLNCIVPFSILLFSFVQACDVNIHFAMACG